MSSLVSVGIEELAASIEFASRTQLTEDDIKQAIKYAKSGTKKLSAAAVGIADGIYEVAPEPVSGPQHPALFGEDQ